MENYPKKGIENYPKNRIENYPKKRIEIYPSHMARARAVGLSISSDPGSQHFF